MKEVNNMYFRRKMDKILEDWLQNPYHSPALVYGVRQSGKTKTIRHFAEQHFKYVNYIDFWRQRNFIRCFQQSLDVDSLIRNLQFENPSFRFVPGETAIIFDEIQDCSRARLSLKYFKDDPRFQVLASGSYLGLNIDSHMPTPKPNGAEDIFEMKTMDFEEFLWANGYTDDQLAFVRKCAKDVTPIPESIHETFRQLYRRYLCLGGYPEVLLLYLQTNHYELAFNKLRDLVFDMKGDPAKRLNENGEPMYTLGEVSRIQNAFDLIASSSFQDNRRFIVSRIEGGNGLQKNDAIDYLLNAGVSLKVHNVSNLSVPLSTSKVGADFKMFYTDIGILTYLSGLETVQAINNDTLGENKGYFFESAIAEALYKAGFQVFYFRKGSGLEVDFVIARSGIPTLIEVKARNGNTKSTRTILSHPEHYGHVKAIKFADANIGERDNILTLPLYMAFAIEDDPVKLV